MISARLGCAFLVAAAVAAPASADVTLRQKFSGKMAMAGAMSGEGAVYIKGNRMRNENGMGGQGTATIFDLDSQQMIVNGVNQLDQIVDFTQGRGSHRSVRYRRQSECRWRPGLQLPGRLRPLRR